MAHSRAPVGSWNNGLHPQTLSVSHIYLLLRHVTVGLRLPPAFNGCDEDVGFAPEDRALLDVLSWRLTMVLIVCSPPSSPWETLTTSNFLLRTYNGVDKMFPHAEDPPLDREDSALLGVTSWRLTMVRIVCPLPFSPWERTVRRNLLLRGLRWWR